MLNFINDIRRRISEIQTNRGKEVKKFVVDLKALIQLRIQRSGKGYNNEQYSPYSDGYVKARKKAGYQTSFVDITRSGQMWGSVRPKVKSGLFITTVTLQANGLLNLKKINSFAKKRSNPLIPTKKELSLVSKWNNDRIRKYLI